MDQYVNYLVLMAYALASSDFDMVYFNLTEIFHKIKVSNDQTKIHRIYDHFHNPVFQGVNQSPY